MIVYDFPEAVKVKETKAFQVAYDAAGLAVEINENNAFNWVKIASGELIGYFSKGKLSLNDVKMEVILGGPVFSRFRCENI